jgi:hypothetical protein
MMLKQKEIIARKLAHLEKMRVPETGFEMRLSSAQVESTKQY